MVPVDTDTVDCRSASPQAGTAAQAIASGLAGHFTTTRAERDRREGLIV